MVPFEHVFHRIRAGHPTLRVGQVQRTAVAVGRVGFVGREEKRLEPLVKKRDATHADGDRKSTRLNSSHLVISYAVFCLKKKKKMTTKCPCTTPTTSTGSRDT